MYIHMWGERVKGNTLYFARVHLYCSMTPLMYGMTTLVPSINTTVDEFGFLLGLAYITV